MLALQLKICSTVIRPALNSACSSASDYSALLFNRLRMMRSMTTGMTDEANGAVVLAQLEIALFGGGMNSDWVHSLGHLFSSQIFWHSAVIAAVVDSPPC
ncbi:hypothetical protein DPMN_189500 [Dreissena polymorpha]|uniref:Uncharacterized protein n=1 Tax=Dreissena polymorpha TaxID=45954 RepID=A0A9D4DTM8_DREPO|nr:hypothetical protein DPMN_189500 [Dreissena polymorpha]